MEAKDTKPGARVYYTAPHGATQNGRVKSVNAELGTAFVVYNCNGDWDNYENYTGQSTRLADLTLGWSMLSEKDGYVKRTECGGGTVYYPIDCPWPSPASDKIKAAAHKEFDDIIARGGTAYLICSQHPDTQGYWIELKMPGKLSPYDTIVKQPKQII